MDEESLEGTTIDFVDTPHRGLYLDINSNFIC